MVRRFDEALDACMTMLMQGATIDECLARYPDEAEELRPHLLAFAAAARMASVQVSHEAKTRGRERLRAELAALEQRDRQRAAMPPWSGWFRRSWPAFPVQRWTVAATAVLLLILGGTGTVAASRGTIPGDAFYPVKIATERARLALAIAEEDRASMHVSFAERRAKEIGALLERGDSAQAVAVVERLASHLESAGKLSSEASTEVRSELQERIAHGSSRALAALQVSLGTASKASDAQIERTFNTAGNAYARAIETFSGTETQPLAIAVDPGSIQLRASDPPPPGIDQVLATVLRVDAYLPSGRDRGWVTVIEGPITFDLKQASELPRFLGEREVAAGTYTRLRLQLGDAMVLAGGVSHQAGLTATSFELPRPFKVDPRKTTVVVLDFDGIDTVRVNPGGQFVFTPDVRVLAHEPGVRPFEPERRVTRPAPQAADVTPTPIQPVAEVVGELEEVTGESITVNGKKIKLDVKTVGGPAVEKGASVRIEVQAAEDGSFRARQIEVIPPAGRKGDKANEDKARDEKARKEEKPAEAATPAPAVTPTPETPAEFTGLVGAIEGDRWIVAGRRVLITDQTRLSADPVVGAVARVIGVLGSDGVIRASVVIFERPPARPTEPTATPTPRPTPESRPTPERPATRPQSSAAPVVEITGTLNSYTGSIWDVGGKKVRVPPSTPVLGVLVIGAEVRVIGGLQPDGSVLAVTVEIKPKLELPSLSPVPATSTPSPRPDTPTPAATPPSKRDEESPGKKKSSETPGGGPQELPTAVPQPGGKSNAPTAEPRGPDPTATPTSSLAPADTPGPTSTAIPTATPSPTQAPAPASVAEVVISGLVTRLKPLEVDGVRVIESNAQVIGNLTLNARVTVRGRLLPNGSIDATVISVE
ncbi:MAG: DUF4382 domain-containing protein [Chloroflexi bacterium]|nr:DUF4382 domain-containing protein [Chloroflexota bacterium]